MNGVTAAAFRPSADSVTNGQKNASIRRVVSFAGYHCLRKIGMAFGTLACGLCEEIV